MSRKSGGAKRRSAAKEGLEEGSTECLAVSEEEDLVRYYLAMALQSGESLASDLQLFVLACNGIIMSLQGNHLASRFRFFRHKRRTIYRCRDDLVHLSVEEMSNLSWEEHLVLLSSPAHS
jgi:hypothetical protein